MISAIISSQGRVPELRGKAPARKGRVSLFGVKKLPLSLHKVPKAI